MPRSACPTLWVPRASSQTDPGSWLMSTALTGLDGLVAWGRALSALEQLPQGGQLALDRSQPLVEGAHLAAQVRHGLDRRGAESLGLLIDVAQPVAEDELVDAAENSSHRREHADQRALEHEGGALVRRSGVHVGERKGLRSGGRRSRQKDTVFLCKRPPGDPAVVGAKEPSGAVPAEELAALAAALGEVAPESLVAPDPLDALGDPLGALGVEDQARIADQLRQPGRRCRRDRQPGRERLADRQAPAFESAREDESGRQLVEAAQLLRADEAGEGEGVREAQLAGAVTDPVEGAGRRAGADQGDGGPGPLADERQGLEQPLVVLVGPGPGGIEEESLREREPGTHGLELLRRGLRILAEHRGAGDDGDLVRIEAVAVDQVLTAPGGHRDHHLRPLAVSAVDLLTALVLPAAEELRQVEMLEVVRLVEAGDRSREGVLEGEVDGVDARALDRPIGVAHRVARADPRAPLDQR